MPVSWLMMRTSAPATTAPLGSSTVPLMAPVAPPCANACATQTIPTKLIQDNLPNDLGIHSSLMSALLLSTVKGVVQNGKGQAAQPPWLVRSRHSQPVSAIPTQDRA